MASGAITYQVGGPSAPAFAQQGQVDWVAFGNTTWSMTSALLQRFSGADIQPATYGAGVALGCRFTLGSRAQHRIEKILDGLQGRGSFHNILWFGFGYRSFVNMIKTTRPGFQLVALCACIAETHSLDVAGFILQEVWKKCEFPIEYEPSHEQFANLVKPCQGIFAASSFGSHVNRMLGSEWSTELNSKNDWDRCAQASDIAKVLRALFDISNGRIDSITVSGGCECAWVGAVAEWLFDLNVQVEGVHDEMPEYQSPHVVIKYVRN